MNRLNDLKFINHMRERNIWCNAKIISNDGKSFSVHSYMMMVASEFFWAAFQFGPNHGKQGPERTKVVVPCVDSTTLSTVIKFAYLNHADISRANVWSLLRAADFLQMHSLTLECLTFMQENMCFTTCSNLLEMTHKELYMPSVRELAESYAQHNLCDPKRSLTTRRAAVRQLSADVLLYLLASDLLYAPREELVWQAIVSWLDGNPSRLEYLPSLFETLRLGLLPTQYIAEHVLGHPVVHGSSLLVQLLERREHEMETWLSLQDTQESPPLDMQPRMPHTLLVCAGGWVSHGPSHEMLVFDPQANRWTRVQALEHPEEIKMAYHGLVHVGDYLYVVGGTEAVANSSGADTARCMRLSLSTLRWQTIAPLLQARNFISCVALHGRLYAMGGRTNGYNRQNTMEVYDPETNEWSLAAPMSEKRSDAGYAVLNDEIYVVGGFTGDEVLASSECFNPITSTWRRIPDMNVGRSGLRCVVARGHLFAIGGFTGSIRLASVERYDPEEQQWLLLETMRVPRSNLSAAVIRDTIVVAGGFSNGSTDPAVEVYDIFEDQWYDLPSLPSSRSALNMVTLEGAAGLASRLLGSRRDLPAMAERHRDRPRPTHVAVDRPLCAPLPVGSGIMPSVEEQSEDLEIHPLAMAMLLDEGELVNGGWLMADMMRYIEESEGDDEEMREWNSDENESQSD